MSPVRVLIALVLVVSCYHIPIKTLFKYVKAGSADELTLRNWILHPALGFSLNFSVLELEELRSPEHLLEALLHVTKSRLGMGGEGDIQEKSSKSGFGRDQNEKLIKRVVRKYHVIIQVVLGLLQREPQKVPAVHVSSFLKDMYVGTMLRLTPQCKAFKWNTEIGVGGAADTAIAVGIVWSFLSVVMSGVSRYVVFTNTRPSIRVNPRFNQVVLDTSILCIFESRFGDIIIAGFRTLLGIIVAYVRGGEQHG